MKKTPTEKTEMLTEAQCAQIERGLTEDVEPRKVAAYLCLHMGLMLSEVAALQRKDVDLAAGTVTLWGAVSAALERVPFDPPRVLPMPPHVARFLESHIALYADGASYLLTGGKTLPAFHLMQNILTAVALKARLGCTVSASDLRNAFIRRCIESGVDLYSLCTYIGIKQPNVIVKRFGEYFTPDYARIAALERFSGDYEPKRAETAFTGPKRMNLLILGAGSQGPVVKEIAEAIGIFDEIAFLDDDPKNKLAIGPLSDIEKLKNRFPMAIPSFDDSHLREKYMDKIESLGYIVPSLIHPSVTLSPKPDRIREVLNVNTLGFIEMSRVLANRKYKKDELSLVAISSVATLGEIVDLLEGFKTQPETLVMSEIPNGSFSKKLYSTYLSYLPKEKAAFPLKMNVDSRGSFTELLKTENCGQFSVNISKPGITKGQHWHNSKWEFFIVVAGHGLIQERKIESDEVLEFEVSGDKIEAVHMLPGYTHNIINLSETENLVTVMWANEQFDPTHPDTYGEAVE